LCFKVLYLSGIYIDKVFFQNCPTLKAIKTWVVTISPVTSNYHEHSRSIANLNFFLFVFLIKTSLANLNFSNMCFPHEQCIWPCNPSCLSFLFSNFISSDPSGCLNLLWGAYDLSLDPNVIYRLTEKRWKLWEQCH
jgi:hypothetical protein